MLPQIWSRTVQNTPIVQPVSKFTFLTFGCLGLLAAGFSAASATSAVPITPTVKLDPRSVQSSADSLYSAVEQAVSAAGGNLAEQHLNLAVGFSTGHFASDPGMAEAARAISTALVDAHLVQGDTVRAYAWEMNVWPHPGSTLNPFQVPGSAAGSPGKSEVNRLWPRSTQSGSQGGHDTERAAVEMAQTLDPAEGSVMVLLTNTAYSIASKTAEADRRFGS